MPTVEKPNTELVVQPAAAITPMRLLEIATTQDADLDKLQKLMELQMVWEANEARKAYYAAMKLFKDNPPHITKNGRGHNDAKYATLDHACAQIIPALAAVGITHKWPMKAKDGKVSLSCVLTHQLGYSEPDPPTIEAGADTSGNKNAIQALGSSIKYLERYTLFAACGLDDGGKDDDGGSGGGVAEDVISVHVKRLEGCATLVDLQKSFEEAYKAAGDDKNAAGQFIRARDKRKQEIRSSPPASPQRIADALVVERLNWIEDAKDIKELQRIYDNALKMARAHGDTDFEARLLAAAKKRSEAISAGN